MYRSVVPKLPGFSQWTGYVLQITLFTVGTRGDSSSFVALAGRPDFTGLATYGIAFELPGHSYQSLFTRVAGDSTIGSDNMLTMLPYGLKQRGYYINQPGQVAWYAVHIDPVNE